MGENMKWNLVVPLGIIGLFVVIFSLSSWFLYPEWQTRPYGLLELIIIVGVGSVAFLNALVSFIKNLRELRSANNKENRAHVAAHGDRSVAIGGDVKHTSIKTGDDK